MEKNQPKKETLRSLADDGNEEAMNQLAGLLAVEDDLAGLWELLDEGSMRAGQLLTARAVETGDLLELQRISDAGYPAAGNELNRLLGDR